MGIIAASATAIGKLILVGILLAAFLAGMAGVVYMSLSGTEVKVPEIVGKDFVESEKELAALGLKIKKRADRPSSEKMNTVLEQLPRPGETVKTGQMILVVVAKAPAAGEEAPKSLIQDIESDDTEKIEEMISDKPKTTRTNTNSNSNRKKADTTRDVIANSSPTSSNTSDPDSTPKSSDDATGVRRRLRQPGHRRRQMRAARVTERQGREGPHNLNAHTTDGFLSATKYE
jgi:beta-lactam-binding protein with PASTA domain